MKKDIKYDIGKKIGTVTRMPAFVLAIQGWLDSRKGEKSIPDAKVESMKNKCTSIEKREALITESRYEPVRKEGKKALKIIKEYKDMQDAPEIQDNSPYAIRERARQQRVKAETKGKQTEAKIKLLEVKESLVHADIVLVERIRRTREKALNVKIAAYIKGVRKGGIPDYNPNLELVDDAYNIYINKHKLGDEAIFTVAEKIMQEAI